MSIYDEPKIDCHCHVLDPARFPYGEASAYRPAGQEVHGGPPLEEAPGILGTLWRARDPDDTTAGGERR